MRNLEKFEEIVKEKQDSILSVFTSDSANLGYVMEEMKDIFTTCDSEDIDIEDISFEVYWRKLVVQNVDNKEVYNKLLIALVSMYGEGKRGKHWDNSIEYRFVPPRKEGRQITIELRVSTEVSGCVLVEKAILIPAKEAYMSKEYEVVCEEES